MTVKVTVKRSFVVNGKEVGSVEELPENVRQAYEKSIAGALGGHFAGAPGAKVKVVFNGTEYESLDAMPPEERRVYESVIGAVEPGHAAEAGEPGGRTGFAPDSGGADPLHAVSAAPIEPGSAGPRATALALVLGLAILLVLLGIVVYTSAGPR